MKHHCLHSFFLLLFFCFSSFRNSTSSRRLSRPWSTQFHPRRPIILKCGRPLLPPTAMSARVSCGALLVRACAALSVVLNVTRSARTCSMQIVYKVREQIHLYTNTLRQSRFRSPAVMLWREDELSRSSRFSDTCHYECSGMCLTTTFYWQHLPNI